MVTLPGKYFAAIANDEVTKAASPNACPTRISNEAHKKICREGIQVINLNKFK